MPWLIAERPELVETYQSVPGRPEATFGKADLIASFLGMRPGQAHFIGLYRRGTSRSLDRSTFWSIVEHQALRDLGYEGFTAEQEAQGGTLRQFELELLRSYPEWRGRIVIDDERDGKSYVGSACRAANILGRWQSYASTGHRGNRDLLGRDP